MNKPFAGTTLKQVAMLAGIVGPLALLLGWQATAERGMSLAYATLELGAPVTTAQSAFSRPPDCVFVVGDYSVEYFLSPGPLRLWGGPERRCRQAAKPTHLTSWKDLPQAYSAAVVVVGQDERVHGLSLIGEDEMRSISGSFIGRD